MTFSFRRACAAATLTAFLALTALAGAAPAQAHDALASTSPSNGQTITENPGKVSITLNNAPDTRIPGSNSIEVTAPDGHVVSTGDITADGATLSIAADIDHAGEHTVAWRAVSADGHPIEGNFFFTYAPAEGEGHSEPAAPTTGAAPATPAGSASVAPETAAATPTSSQSGDNTGLIIGIGAVLLVLVAASAYLIGRRTKANASSTD
ncbi:copper resistance CopC family protein [Paenarthrobacter ureafaciens]|uniref:copper resistance CopC family protein n=1 Tax=Paenarthrobacter ureafaciens TaxID=37931 RepID=UPI0034DB7C24